MVFKTDEIINTFVGAISAMKEVKSIGISGAKTNIQNPGEGDIDIFIYCDKIPALKKRQAVLNQWGNAIQEMKINTLEGGHWGTGDYALINGVETWFMYFKVNDTLEEVESILNGDHPDRLDNYYYPVGRCAMFKQMNILSDKNGFLHSLQEMLSEYPEKLEKTQIQYHLNMLEDTEDLERAAARKDVLFYHFALDSAIDHFLQALFAMNKTYFPSRKRTLSFIRDFNKKPEKCDERLLEVIRLGVCSETINQSYILLRNLMKELFSLGAAGSDLHSL
ncbi:MAG: DUF4037 domain-containing protein [Christensenellales bacterium]